MECYEMSKEGIKKYSHRIFVNAINSKEARKKFEQEIKTLNRGN